MHVGETPRNLISPLCILRRHRPHADHQLPLERPGRLSHHLGAKHRYIAPHGNMPYIDTGIHQGFLKGKAAADQKHRHIILPVRRSIRHFLYQHAIFKDAVLGNIRQDICPLAHVLHIPAAMHNLQKRAWLGILPGKPLKVPGIFLRHNHQIRLGIAVAHAGSLPGDFTAPDFQPYILRPCLAIICHENHSCLIVI